MSVANCTPYKRGLIDDGGWTALIALLCAFGLLYSNVAAFVTARFLIPATPIYFLLIFCGAVIAGGVIKARPLHASSKAISAALLAYLAMTALQIVFTGPPPGDVLKFRVFWALVTIAAIVCLTNVRARTFLRVFRAVCLLSVLMMFLEYATRFAPPFRMSIVVGRAAGFFMNPNISALFLGAAVPIVTLRLGLVGRLAWYAAIAAATLITFSRGGMLLCAAMIAMAEIFPASHRTATNYWTKLVLLLIAVLVVYAIQDLIFQIISGSLGGYLDANTANRLRFGDNESSAARLYVIQLALGLAKDSIVFGRGIGFGNAWSQSISVHNIFVLVLLEQGIIGLLWLAALLAAVLSVRPPFGVWAAAVVVVGGMFNHNLFDSPTYGMIIAAYAVLPAMWEQLPVLTSPGKGAAAGRSSANRNAQAAAQNA